MVAVLPETRASSNASDAFIAVRIRADGFTWRITRAGWIRSSPGDTRRIIFVCPTTHQITRVGGGSCMYRQGWGLWGVLVMSAGAAAQQPGSAGEGRPKLEV